MIALLYFCQINLNIFTGFGILFLAAMVTTSLCALKASAKSLPAAAMSPPRSMVALTNGSKLSL